MKKFSVTSIRLLMIKLQLFYVLFTGNNLVNTVTPPLVPSVISQLSSPVTSLPTTSTSTMPLVQTVAQVNTIGQVPTTVHTVPLITSVNGQWTFSLQPIMSVGGLDVSILVQNRITFYSLELLLLYMERMFSFSVYSCKELYIDV